MRVRPMLALLASLAATALFGSAPAAGDATPLGYEPRFEPAPCPAEFPLPALRDARCGFLVVPENRARPTGKTIRLAVAIVPAVANRPAPDPFVHLTGGPGGVAILEAQRLVDAGFNRERDLILMDQRGTFLSEPALICPSFDSFAVEQVGLPLDTESTRRAHVAATRACRDELVERGVDIAAYNTTENAADFADLRRALGYDRYNVFGVSYGTDLAQTLMRNHPEGIRSVILDSVVPRSLVGGGGFWHTARAGLQSLFETCVGQAGCRRSFPRLERTFTRLVRRLESKPVRTTVADPQTGTPTKVVLDGGALVNWLVAMSFQTPQFENVPAWIAQLAAGKPESVARSRAAQVTPPGFVGVGLTFGVICSEWVPFVPRSDVLGQGREVLPGYPRSVLAEAPQFTYIYDDCKVWDIPAAPASVRAPLQSDIPTLLLAGTFDAVTSVSWAYAVADGLPNSRVVPIPGVGHFVAPESTCAQSIVASFLERPGAPDTGCVASVRPPTFRLTGGPRTPYVSSG